LVVVTAQITAMLKAMMISAQAGYWGQEREHDHGVAQRQHDRDRPAPGSAGQQAGTGAGDDHP
jgi:hypothetical protein